MDVNYPLGIKKEKHQLINYSHRGMTLEDDINESNLYYREHDIAYIYKKPTPIKVTKVHFNNQKQATIKEAFFLEPSTTDYNGIYQGKYIDFEAKETKNKTSFPLANIHPHQIKHLENITRHGGIGFLIVRFSLNNLTFLLTAEDFLNYIKKEKRKSISLTYFQEKGYLIEEALSPRLKYLDIIKRILEVS
ncbi:MAG TPA: Holliday junction resolvase RecU [Candidatus Onthousia faecigallinarum]|nr:Holliday junction resolvase RecU [Candidatus Onthousia faecigallinarum]